MAFDFPALPPDALCQRVLEQAEHAFSMGEIPIAAAIIRRYPEAISQKQSDVGEWECLGLASNLTATERDPLAHAEIQAIRQARQRLQREYLSDCALITSLEPCLFCSGALLLSRIGAIYYFTGADKGIRLQDVISLSADNKTMGLRAGVSNHHPVIIQVERMAEPARALLGRFFQGRRSGSMAEIPKAD